MIDSWALIEIESDSLLTGTPNCNSTSDHWLHRLWLQITTTFLFPFWKSFVLCYYFINFGKFLFPTFHSNTFVWRPIQLWSISLPNVRQTHRWFCKSNVSSLRTECEGRGPINISLNISPDEINQQENDNSTKIPEDWGHNCGGHTRPCTTTCTRPNFWAR